MNRFTKKVSLAAVVIALAGIAGASQSHAQNAPVTDSSWFSTYATDAIANAPRQRHVIPRVVILKGTSRATLRSTGKTHLRHVARGSIKTYPQNEASPPRSGQLGRLAQTK